jgi:Na+/melibiose symporter-like transporter
MYAASMTWVNKLSISGVAAVSGFILIAAGWVQDAGVDQAEGTFEKMRWVFSLGTVGLALGASALLRLYSLDESEDK